jgi:hypothetical protein
MEDSLTFVVIPTQGSAPEEGRNLGILEEDRWDDWGKYRTQFALTVFDADGVSHPIGDVKIAQFGLKPHSQSPEIPAGHRFSAIAKTFDQLDDTFFR